MIDIKGNDENLLKRLAALEAELASVEKNLVGLEGNLDTVRDLGQRVNIVVEK